MPQLEDKKEVEKVLMKKLATRIFQIVALLFLIGTYNNFSMNLPVAVKIEKENVVLNEIKQDLKHLNVDIKKIPELLNQNHFQAFLSGSPGHRLLHNNYVLSHNCLIQYFFCTIPLLFRNCQR